MRLPPRSATRPPIKISRAAASAATPRRRAMRSSHPGRFRHRHLARLTSAQRLVHAISAAAGEGVKELVRGIADALDKIPKETVDDEDSELKVEEEVNEVKDSEAAAIVDDLENEE